MATKGKTTKTEAKKATKTNTNKTEGFRSGSFLVQLHALLSDGEPHTAEAIVKALQAEEHLYQRTAAGFVGGFRAGLKKAGYTLTSTDKGYVMTQANA